MATRYVHKMDVVAKIRRNNLKLLLGEIGDKRGAAAELARLTGVKAPIISQLQRQTFSSSGKERRMGDAIARKLERGMNKPEGWMDHPHDITRTESEADFLVTLRLLSDEQRDHLQKLAEMLVKSRSPAGSDPLDTAPPGRKRH